MNKTGSSLIAVVLLIGLTATIAIGVFIFTQKTTTKEIEKVELSHECDPVKIKIKKACYTPNEIKLTLESKSPKEIDFLINVIGNNTELLPSPIFTLVQGFHIEDISIPYTSTGNIQQIKIIPKIKTEKKQLICNLQSDTYNINIC